MNLYKIVNGPYATNCYVIKNGQGLTLIDAPAPAKKLISKLETLGDVENILLTHGHFDHVLAISELRLRWPNLKVYIASEDAHYLENEGVDIINEVSSFDPFFSSRYAEYFTSIKKADVYLNDGDIVQGFEVIALPGHTFGSVGYYNKSENIMFSGDTLFEGSVGRTDLGGDSTLLLQSLKKLKKYPGSTIIYPGHGNPTQLELEFKVNPYFS